MRTPRPPAGAPAPLIFGRLSPDDAQAASTLILVSFWRFNADQYGDNTRAFTDLVTPEALRALIERDVVVGAKDAHGALHGVICITTENHLELLFVSEAMHRQGVATALWQAALDVV